MPDSTPSTAPNSPLCGACLQPCEGHGAGRPRLLPCTHRFCQACLQHQLGTRPGSKRHLTCPLCQVLVRIPSGGVSAFPSDPLYRGVPVRAAMMPRKKLFGSVRCKTHRRETCEHTCMTCDRHICNRCRDDGPHRGHTVSKTTSRSSPFSPLSARLLSRTRQTPSPRKRRTLKTALEHAWATVKAAHLSSGGRYGHFPSSGVQSMCPLPDGSLWVARGSADGAGQAVRYSQQGHELRSSSVRGRVSMAAVSDEEVYVEGPENPVQKLRFGNTNLVSYEGDDDILFDLYNKKQLRFSLDFHADRERAPRLCRWEMSGEGFELLAEGKAMHPLMSLQSPVAMDADRAGQRVAVVDEAVNQVLVYRKGASLPCCKYTGDGVTPFRPRDVCFAFLQGKEKLIVADWSSCSLHVIRVNTISGKCALVGYLGNGSVALRTHRPTSLVVEQETGQLWIGCDSGHVFSLDLGQ